MTEDLNRERANAESVFTLNRRAEFVMTAHFADLPPVDRLEPQCACRGSVPNLC